MYDQALRRKLRRPRSNAVGEMQLRVFGPRGERLKRFLEDFRKALKE